jgi:hypothetical protein
LLQNRCSLLGSFIAFFPSCFMWTCLFVCERKTDFMFCRMLWLFLVADIDHTGSSTWDHPPPSASSCRPLSLAKAHLRICLITWPIQWLAMHGHMPPSWPQEHRLSTLLQPLLTLPNLCVEHTHLVKMLFCNPLTSLSLSLSLSCGGC